MYKNIQIYFTVNYTYYFHVRMIVKKVFIGSVFHHKYSSAKNRISEYERSSIANSHQIEWTVAMLCLPLIALRYGGYCCSFLCCSVSQGRFSVQQQPRSPEVAITMSISLMTLPARSAQAGVLRSRRRRQ